MKIRFVVVCALMVMMSASGLSQTSRPADSPTTASIEGVWRANMNGLPAIALILTTESGSLSGAVQFYFQHRDTVEQPWTSTPGLPEPLFNLKFDGTTLTFQVSHRRAHPPGSLKDPPVSFHMKLIAPDKAELVNELEPGTQGVLVRSPY